MIKRLDAAPLWTLLLAVLGLMLWSAGCGKSAKPVKKVPRNRTLILECADEAGGQLQGYDAFNPYQVISGRTGWNFLYEPLYFYAAHRPKDNFIPWIATGPPQFNEDFTEVTIKIRDGVTWSDGVPWTAADIVFTIEMLKNGPKGLRFRTDMRTWVDQVTLVDEHTVHIKLTAPNPRFIFSYFTHNFENGIPIVPKHIWEGKDPLTFANLDIEKGWPVVSGPYRVVHSSPQQRILDRTDNWWAARVGFREMPKVERLIFLPAMEESKRVANIILNNVDCCLDLRPQNVRTVLDRNPNITTWTGDKPPYGYLDWWPISLGFNVLEPPFDDPEIRWAVNYAINRDQIIEVGWKKSGSPTLLPLPDFPPMREFTGSVEHLLKKYPVGTYDPAKTAEIMVRKGWQRDDDGFWTKDGERFKIVVEIFTFFQDFTPVLIEQLRAAGFEASFRMTSDSGTRMAQGVARTFITGNGGSVRDPYFTLRLYHSRFVQPTGTAGEYFWRWKNENFDAIVDQMGRTAPDDPKLKALFVEAMDIWLKELPAIPLVQWYHRIPHNQTYWRNWPSADNPYVNTAYWHRTALLVLLNLEPVE